MRHAEWPASRTFRTLNILVEAFNLRRGMIGNDLPPELRPEADDEVHASRSGSWFTNRGDSGGELSASLPVEEVELQVRVRRGSKGEDPSLWRVHKRYYMERRSARYGEPASL
jgi:hypothetical protein